jgi:hypothetical protein
MAQVIARGQGSLRWNQLARRTLNALVIYLSQRTTLKTRRVTSLLHLGVVIGFTYFFLVNAVDLLYGFVPGFTAPYQHTPLSASLPPVRRSHQRDRHHRRELFHPGAASVPPSRRELRFRDNVLLHPRAQQGGIRADHR